MASYFLRSYACFSRRNSVSILLFSVRQDILILIRQYKTYDCGKVYEVVIDYFLWILNILNFLDCGAKLNKKFLFFSMLRINESLNFLMNASTVIFNFFDVTYEFIFERINFGFVFLNLIFKRILEFLYANTHLMYLFLSFSIKIFIVVFILRLFLNWIFSFRSSYRIFLFY